MSELRIIKQVLAGMDDKHRIMTIDKFQEIINKAIKEREDRTKGKK